MAPVVAIGIWEIRPADCEGGSFRAQLRKAS